MFSAYLCCGIFRRACHRQSLGKDFRRSALELQQYSPARNAVYRAYTRGRLRNGCVPDFQADLQTGYKAYAKQIKLRYCQGNLSVARHVDASRRVLFSAERRVNRRISRLLGGKTVVKKSFTKAYVTGIFCGQKIAHSFIYEVQCAIIF